MLYKHIFYFYAEWTYNLFLKARLSKSKYTMILFALWNTNCLKYLKIKSETQFFKQNVSCSCSCGEQYTWNTMQYNCHDLFKRHFWTPILSSEIPTDFMKNSLKWFCVFHSRIVKLWVRSWHYKSWTNFSVLEFMTQVQSAQVINLSKKKGRFCNWQHRPRKQLSEILYLRVQIQGGDLRTNKFWIQRAVRWNMAH